MKNSLLLLTTCILITFAGCKKNVINSNYSGSYTAWLNYKSSVKNSYIYVNIYGSVFGSSASIQTTVKNGVIIARDFTASQYPANSQTAVVVKQWHEDSTSLNTHGTEAGDLLTIDQVYDRANTVWLKMDPKANNVIFETKNAGLISQAGYIPNGCQDDCFNGITITSITAL